ncbi:hypothetical protein FlaCF_0204 [Flavobacterium tructae]
MTSKCIKKRQLKLLVVVFFTFSKRRKNHFKSKLMTNSFNYVLLNVLKQIVDLIYEYRFKLME